MKLKILSITFLFDCCQIVFLIDSMKKIFDQRFFRLLSECSQRKVSASEFAEAIEELATHVANFSINEQDYNVLLRYFSFGLHRLKSYRVRFEQELLRLRGKRLPMGNNGSGRKSGGGGQIPEGGYRMQRYGASDGDSG